MAPSSAAHEASLLYQALQPELQCAIGGIGSQAAGNFARRERFGLAANSRLDRPQICLRHQLRHRWARGSAPLVQAG